MFLDEPLVVDYIKQEDLNSAKIFAFNIESHEKLASKNISHEIADNYLDREERSKIFDYASKSYRWYEKCPQSTELEFNGVNLLGIMGPLEFHEFLIISLTKFFVIKKIIEIEKPQKIITTTNLEKFVKPHQQTHNFTIQIYPGKEKEIGFTADTIEIKLNLFSFPLSFNVSKSAYYRVKNLYENAICTLFNLWHKPQHKKTILLLEFNPSNYRDLLYELSKLDRNIILFNLRRSAIWNLESIKILSKTNCKILNQRKLLDKKTEKNLLKLKDEYIKKLKNFWLKDEFFTKEFTFNGVSFWQCIREKLLLIYYNRLYEYLRLVAIIKKIFDSLDISCVLTLNEVGETENIVLKLKNQIPSFLCVHSFTSYEPFLYKIRWKYDDPGIVPLKSDKILLWGDTEYEYYKQNHVDPGKLIITGSPRHDSFFNNKKNVKSVKNKVILLTLTPITNLSALGDTNLAIRYENLLKRIFHEIHKLENIDVIVKLHPGENKHNWDLYKQIKKIDKNIPIFHIKSIVQLIQSCDVLVNIIPEYSVDSSAVVLEGMILEKPVMQIILDDNVSIDLKDPERPILTVPYDSDLEQKLNLILFDNDFRVALLANSKRHLEKYLANHGNASKNIAKILGSF